MMIPAMHESYDLKKNTFRPKNTTWNPSLMKRTCPRSEKINAYKFVQRYLSVLQQQNQQFPYKFVPFHVLSQAHTIKNYRGVGVGVEIIIEGFKLWSMSAIVILMSRFSIFLQQNQDSNCSHISCIYLQIFTKLRITMPEPPTSNLVFF